jgi:hypothetical protein
MGIYEFCGQGDHLRMHLRSCFTIIVVGLYSVTSVFASRTSAPLLPPGQAPKVTRADFKEREEKEQERERRLQELETQLEISETVREERRLAIEAEKEAARQALAQAKAQAPEDFLANARDVVMTEAPKVASLNETVVQNSSVVAAATKVIVRRSR